MNIILIITHNGKLIFILNINNFWKILPYNDSNKFLEFNIISFYIFYEFVNKNIRNRCNN